MKWLKKVIFGVLVSIMVVGLIGIPMGDPKFFFNAIFLESLFVTLAAISIWRLSYSIVPNMIIALIVIAGNTLSPKHIEIMTTFSPAENALVLILGGYVLQGLLFATSAIALKKRNQIRIHS